MKLSLENQEMMILDGLINRMNGIGDVNRWITKRMDGRMERQKDGWMKRCRLDGQINDRTNGWNKRGMYAMNG